MSLVTDKKHTISIALSVATAIAIGSIAAVMLAASPADLEDELDYLASSKDPIRIVAPTVSDYSYETAPLYPASTRVDWIECTAGAVEAAAPETVAPPETTIPPIVTAPPETTAAPETTVPETTAAPVTTAAPETTAAPVTTKAPETTSLPKPAPAPKLLADELKVVHTFKDPLIAVTEEEIRYAATIIQLEVMGNNSKLYAFEDVNEKYWEMLSVAQCIRNRMESKRFPNTAHEVMFQYTIVGGRKFYQFSPSTALDYYAPTEEALIAAREVLVNGVTVLPANYYYFCASRIESNFEEWNDYMLVKNADGSYDKKPGHLTTFYAGHH